jgi:hypothetical protein
MLTVFPVTDAPDTHPVYVAVWDEVLVKSIQVLVPPADGKANLTGETLS